VNDLMLGQLQLLSGLLRMLPCLRGTGVARLHTHMCSLSGTKHCHLMSDAPNSDCPQEALPLAVAVAAMISGADHV
jgi:hypothetical protein